MINCDMHRRLNDSGEKTGDRYTYKLIRANPSFW